MKLQIAISLTALGLSVGSCRNLSNSLGQNLYERELEDSFDDEPAGVVGTTPNTRLVIFRENSFVTEPRPEGELLGDGETGFGYTAPESSQGLRLFREASFRLAEARANSLEGMLAMREAGVGDHIISKMFPTREDWARMYMNTLKVSREAILAEIEAETEQRRNDLGSRQAKLDSEIDVRELDFELEMRKLELEAEVNGLPITTPLELTKENEARPAEWNQAARSKANYRAKQDTSAGKPHDPNQPKKKASHCLVKNQGGHLTKTCPHPVIKKQPKCESTAAASPLPQTPNSTLTTVPDEDRLFDEPFRLASIEAASSDTELEAMQSPPREFSAKLKGTSKTPQAGKPWKIKYRSLERAGKTIKLVVHSLDSPRGENTSPDLTATFTATLNKKGRLVLKADLPKDWQLVRLEAPGAKPLFAVFM